MLEELIKMAADAYRDENLKELQKIFASLEKLGMDRATALTLVREYLKNRGDTI